MKLSSQEQLQLFVERVQELVSTRLFKDQQLHNYKPRIRWDENSGTSFQAEIDEDDLKSFLLTFRHFIAEKEPTFFYSVRSTCYKCMKPHHEHEHDQLEKAKESWGNALRGVSDIKFIIENQELTPEHTLDLYIDGKYFHNDADYKAELDRLAELPIPLDRMRFILTLQDLTQIIIWTGHFVAYGLNHDWFDFS